KSVEWLVLDEADKLLDLGFLEQLDEILSSCSNSKLHCSLFSATISEKVQELARTILRDPVSVFVGKRNTPTETIMQELKYCGREDGKLLAIRQLFNTGLEPPVLIFVQSVDRAKQLFHELVYDNINVDAIHSERTQAQRDSVIRKFRSGDIWVLIATDVLGRGMDFKGVNVVINYDFPTSTANYIHRIGRTGRAGRAGKAITFFTNEDFTNLRSIVNIIKESGGEVPEWLLKFKRPNAKKRKQLEKKPVDREDISIIPNKRKK
ncbi:DEAD box protein 52 homolog, partial [Zophobas morio]|uniref:DEAD box protein 52 homolog n=1 Tax=Zophobas morio TaxID=2755281 RepID=UPI003083B523